MKIITIIGARPQFVKAAVVSRAIARHNAANPSQRIEEKIVHTGQHYDANMSDVFFDEMQIPQPDYHFNIGGGSHGAMTGRMLEKIEGVLIEEKPDVVLVYGDTNSTLAGALAAAKMHIPVAHVEAGLRSFNMRMPEEVNRLLTDHISAWLFCPTEAAAAHLRHEGIDKKKVYLVGDVMYDAALFYQLFAKPSERIAAIAAKSKNFYLATVHRAENTDDISRITAIISGLAEIAAHTPVLLPLHPRTKKIIAANGIPAENITLLDPVGYFDMVFLLKSCAAVFTDSGGVQKEAYFFAKPCITFRDETEWMELVKHGYNVLAGADKESIVAAEQSLSGKKCDFSLKLYGDGYAGDQIVKILLKGK